LYGLDPWAAVIFTRPRLGHLQSKVFPSTADCLPPQETKLSINKKANPNVQACFHDFFLPFLIFGYIPSKIIKSSHKFSAFSEVNSYYCTNFNLEFPVACYDKNGSEIKFFLIIGQNAVKPTLLRGEFIFE